MSIKTISDTSFATDVLGSPEPVLVDFGAEWCTHCRALDPSLEQVAAELEGKVTVVKLDIDESPDTPVRYGVRGIPTMILFKDGAPVATQVGSVPKSVLKDWVEGGL